MSGFNQKKEDEENEKTLKVVFTFGSVMLSLILLFILYMYSLQLNKDDLLNYNTTNITNITNITNTTINSTEKQDFLIYYVMFGFFGYGTCICSCVVFLLYCCPDKKEEDKIKENINNKYENTQV